VKQIYQFLIALSLAIASCILASTIFATADLEQNPKAAAQLDLTTFSFKNENYSINKPWDFYFGQLLEPDGLHGVEPTFQVPFLNIRPERFKAGPEKHGTLSINILLPERLDFFSIYFPELRSASKIWINGKLTLEKGVVGTSLSQEVAQTGPAIIDLQGTERELTIVIQTSSYSSLEIGPINHILIGYPSKIHEERQAPKLRDAFAIGAIAIMAFYHLSLYFLRRDRLAPLWFGIFCLLVAVRTLIRSDGNLIYLFVDQPDFHWQYRLEYWGFNLGAAACVYFIYILYSRDVSRLLCKICIVGSLVYAAVVAVFPVRIFAHFLPAFQIFILICASGVIYGLIRAIINRRSGSVLFILGFLALMTGTLLDILKSNDLLNTPTLVHVGLFFFVLFQAIILSKRFARAFARVEEAEVEIRLLNDDLEKKVQERTHTIRIILDNVKAGFLLVDNKILIQDGFTRSCPEILGRNVHDGLNFIDLFDLNKRQKDHLSLAILQVFDDIMPEAVTLSQIPNRIPIGGRIISLQGAVVRDNHGVVQSILFTITDATTLVNTEREAKLNKALLRIMQDKAGFHSFIADSIKDLSIARTALDNNDENKTRMILHTLKGNFYAYDLHDIAQLIHQEEDLEIISTQGLLNIETKIRQFLQEHHELFASENNFSSDKNYILNEARLVKLKEYLLAQKLPPDMRDKLDLWIHEVKQVPFLQLLGPVSANVNRIAMMVGKEIDLCISGGDTLVDADKLRNVTQNIVHLLRNSLDHGIEYPEDRLKKNPRGRIDIIIQRRPKHLSIMVADDGQGLNMDRIKELAISRKLKSQTELQNMSDDRIAKLIFHPGFSTATEVSDISGRGMGMTALLESINQLGGQITIESKKSIGCRFEILIPENQRNKIAAISA